MKIGFLANLNKENAIEASKKALICFKDHGLKVSIEKNLFQADDWFQRFDAYDLQTLIDINDIMAVAGGDGTILSVVKSCAIKDKPVLGINIGNVGFLTESEIHELDETAQALKNSDFTIEYRSMLNLKSGKANAVALNEIVLLKHATARIINFDVYAQNSLIDRYNADGYIVSTPTGSTAYSLSAGGPILSPVIKGLVLTPVCSHSLRSRSIVIGENEIINIKVNTASPDAVLIADGVPVSDFDLKHIQIAKHEKMAGFVKTKPSDFYGKLLSKLNKWSANKED
ncbi:MAG TPA: NAD(+)/NADH kinase [Clostridiales bacterium]|nr:NAD(+)/NADH kinase [Clostridiales bacterium]